MSKDIIRMCIIKLFVSGEFISLLITAQQFLDLDSRKFRQKYHDITHTDTISMSNQAPFNAWLNKEYKPS